jgi:hypothetical protein
MLVAIGLAGTVAYISVTGLLKLFTGLGTAGLILFIVIETSKILITSALHTFSDRMGWGLKTFLVFMVAATMMVTSLGIYGLFSSSYKNSYTKSENTGSQIELLEKKRDGYQGQLEIINKEKESVTLTISDLSNGLSNNVIQYKDRETGEIITTTSSSTRRTLEKQLDRAIERQDVLNTKSEGLSEKVFELENNIMETKLGDDASTELGPLMYLADVTGSSMDDVMKWFMLLLVFIGDPLAVVMVIVFNRAMGKSDQDTDQVTTRSPTDDELYDDHDQSVVDDFNMAVADHIEQQEERLPFVEEKPTKRVTRLTEGKEISNTKPPTTTPKPTPMPAPQKPRYPHLQHGLIEEVDPKVEILPKKEIKDIIIEEENPRNEVVMPKKEDIIIEEENPNDEIDVSDEKVESLWDIVGEQQDKLGESVDKTITDSKVSKTWTNAVNNRRRNGGTNRMGISRL